MKIIHKKIQNTGILFELLVRTITSETLSGKDSKATEILKKHFSKTELGREYKLYEYILKNKNISESKANIIINSVVESSTKLNKTVLRRQKYNLIKEIKEYYDLEEFFKTKIPNYKTHAAIYTLFEMGSNPLNKNLDQSISNKMVLLEYLSNKPTLIKEKKDEVIEEFKKADKDTRILTYRILLDKFNEKYSNLNPDQKTVLKEFITSVDNTPKLKEFYNIQINSIKSNLLTLNKSVKDKTTQIKINEVVNLLKELDKSDKVGNDEMLNLLQYHSLIEELKTIK